MALTDYFLEPLGLAALAALVPLLLLYFLRPKPARVDLPTMRFLFGEEADEARRSVLRALRREWLLLLQLLVLVALAVALASPYVAVAEERVVQERVLVVDTSASMAVEGGDGTRVNRAVALARDRVTATTSVVVTAPDARVVLRQGPRPEARRTLNGLTGSHAPGDLAGAIERASAIAGEDAIVVVLSDFVDSSDWRAALAAARASGHRVEVRSVGDRVANVGIVDVRFSGGTALATVANFGPGEQTRTVTLGGRSTSVELAPGEATTVQLAVPAGGGELRLTPADAFPVDDRVPVAAPADATVDVLLLTNDENRFLTTALSLIDDVELTVRQPPVSVTRDYDVIVFSNVDPAKVLPGNVQAATEVLRRGGGVAIQAQPDLRAVDYGGLLPLRPGGLANGSSVDVADDPLTTGITFSPPERYVTGELRTGRAVVTAADGTPLIATASLEGGTVLYYGYIESLSGFKYNYKYPVFWKRAVESLAGQPSLASLNRRTGTALDVGRDATVEGPTGPTTGPTVPLDRVGFYADGDRRYAAALLDRGESNVTPPAAVDRTDGTGAGSRTERRLVPVDLTPVVAGVALGLGLVELVLLRRRGDL